MRNPIAALAAIGASCVVSSAFAAEEPLDQVIVTGARTPISAADVGSAVTVITRDDIERRQVRYVTELLRAVPGFAVSHSGVVGSQTQVRVRGSEANHVLVLVDGVRANDPATGDEFRWEYLSTANIERIEIVRGPQSALWGSDAIGGVVHIVTRSGSGGNGGSAYVESGARNTLNAAAGGSFGGDTWSVGIGVERLATDGFNISRSGDEDDDAEISTATLNARLAPSEALTVTFGARSVDAYTQFDAVDFVTTGLPADSDVATDTRQAYAHVGAIFGAADARVRHRLGVRYFDSDNENLVDGLYDSSTSSDRTTWAYQADISLRAASLSLAAEHEVTQFTQRGTVVFDDPNQVQETDVTSAIADVHGRAGESLAWLFSLRFDDHSDFDDILTGRMSLAWNVSDATILRAGFGTGQKTPTFIERFGFFPQSFVGNPGLRPEHSTSYDVGLEHAFESLRVQLSLFDQDLDDEINGFFCPNPFPAPCTAVNMDQPSSRRGAEFGAQWSVGDRVAVGVTYTYTHSEDADSAAELRRPRHAGSVHADYSFANGRGRVALAADYGGTRQDVFFPPFPNPSEIVTLGNYWLVGLTAQYDVSDRVRLFARGSNLLDAEYEQVYGYRTPGRALFGGMQVSFGNDSGQ
jgi:vitamin B12 transporter